jgi:hypothetical protein
LRAKPEESSRFFASLKMTDALLTMTDALLKDGYHWGMPVPAYPENCIVA